MTGEILLTLLNVIFGLVLTGIGIEMVNNPPGEVRWKKNLYRALFGLFGTAVIVTTFFQSVRTANTQEAAKNDARTDQLTNQKQISYMTGKLDTISELLGKYASAPTSSPKSDFTALAKTLAAIARTDTKSPKNGRMLSSDEAKQFSGDMANSVPPQIFFTVTETSDHDPSSEQMMFTNQLSEILKTAKWTNLGEELNSGRIKRVVPLPLYKEVSQRGIILYSPQSLMPYAVALANEMDKFSIQHSPVRRMDMMGGDKNIPVDFIIIEIGLQ